MRGFFVAFWRLGVGIDDVFPLRRIAYGYPTPSLKKETSLRMCAVFDAGELVQ